MSYKLFLLFGLALSASSLQAVDFYVSPNGSDQANGLSLKPSHSSGPFATLQRAQQAVRELKKNRQLSEKVIVHLYTGIYMLDKPLEFDQRDSGFPNKEIIWQGEGGPVVISGGVPLTACLATESHLTECSTAGLGLANTAYQKTSRKQGDAPGFDLYLDQTRLPLARWPNSGWAHIRQPLDEKNRFLAIEQLPEIPGDLSQVQVHIFGGNDWYDQYLPVRKAEDNQITLGVGSNYRLGSGRRFYLRNIKSAIDSPGEWYFDRVNEKILLYPPKNNQLSELVASRLPQLLKMNGSAYLKFNDLTFKHCTGIGIGIDKSSYLTLNNIQISNIGSRGIEIKNSQHISMVNSKVYDTGEGGILMYGGDRKTLEPSHNLIHNTHIYQFGMTLLNYSPAIALNGVGVNVTHNLIENGPGLGIWIDGNDHLIEKNEIHHVCEQASDCGAIYSGRDWTYHGNAIRHNSIHDLFGYGLKRVDFARNIVEYARPDGVRGVYLDDGVSGFSILGNIFVNAGQFAIQLGGGRDNKIENNVFVTNTHAILVDHRAPGAEIKKRLAQVPYKSQIWQKKYPRLAIPMTHEEWPEGNTLIRNVMISDNPDSWLFRYLLPSTSNLIAENLVWGVRGPVKIGYEILDRNKLKNDASWEEWQSEGLETGSIYADPCLSINGNSVAFCPSSAVNKIGFESIPADIGLIDANLSK